jgi:hypothetical protein
MVTTTSCRSLMSMSPVPSLCDLVTAYAACSSLPTLAHSPTALLASCQVVISQGVEVTKTHLFRTSPKRFTPPLVAGRSKAFSWSWFESTSPLKARAPGIS